MFVFEEPSDLNDDWYLVDKNKHSENIPKKLLKNITNAHMMGIQFLFENFVRKRGGAILNEDEDLNMPLQVCAFLSSVKGKIDQNSPVLIITSQYSFCRWHYHLSEAGFNPKIISSEDFDPSDLYIVSCDSLKLAEKFSRLDLFCVVIDDFDSLAAKLVVKKLKGCFNIGLTKRNFYQNPDQKLRWLMLNWVSPGCVGKLIDFYRIDRLHSLAFADNYKFWWMRLTWKFCDSFELPTEEYLEEYQRKLQEWGDIHIRLTAKTKQGTKRSIRRKQDTKLKKPKSELSIPSPTLSSSDDSDQSSEISLQMPQKQQSELLMPSMTTSSSDDSDQSSENFLQISQKIAKSQDINEEVQTSSVNLVKEELGKQNDLADSLVKSEETKDDEYEPILSVIKDNSFQSTSATSKNESFLLSFLIDDESSVKNEPLEQSSRDLGDISDYEDNLRDDPDDISFFKEFILGKK